MRRDLLSLYRLLTHREKRWLAMVLTSMLVVAMLELVSIGSVPVVITVVLEPSLAAEYPVPEALRAWLAGTAIRERLIWCGLAVFALFLVRTAVIIGSRKLQLHFSAGRQNRLAGMLFRAYVDAPYEFYLRRDSSELVRNLQTGASRVGGEILNQVLTGAQSAIVLLAIIVLLCWAHPILASACLLVFGLFGYLFLSRTAARSKRFGSKEQEARKQQIRDLRQVFEGIKEIQVLGKSAYFSRRFEQGMRVITHAQEMKLFLAFLSGPLMELVAIVVLFAIPIVLVSQDRSAADSAMLLGLFGMAFLRIKTSLSALLGAITSVKFNAVNIRPIVHDLGLLSPAANAGSVTTTTPGRGPWNASGDLLIEDLSFTYPGAEVPSLSHVNLRIPRGSRVAFVGASGAGKSTLMDVLLGVLRPGEGSVLVGNIDIVEDLESWRSRVAYVPQQVFLVNDTIRRNVALGMQDRDIDDAEVWAALEQARLREFIESLPDGLDTLVNERGLRLSGGQKQRVSIARALFRKPDYLFLDEATAALDHQTEREIVETVRSLPASLTVVVIAHRRTSIEGCDPVFHLEGGRLVDTPHDAEPGRSPQSHPDVSP